MSPTCGPISILVAADTMATLLASNAAIKLASAAVLTTSPVVTLLRQRPIVMRVFFMTGPALRRNDWCLWQEMMTMQHEERSETLH
jgi:hypothetical protein